MKTAKHAFKELFIIILFAFILMWLVSCNSKRARLAEEMHNVKFSLELLGGEINHITKQMNSYQLANNMAFNTDRLTQAQLDEKRKQAKEAEKDYLELSKLRTNITVKMIMLKVKYDSLQTELNKH